MPSYVERYPGQKSHRMPGQASMEMATAGQARSTAFALTLPILIPPWLLPLATCLSSTLPTMNDELKQLAADAIDRHREKLVALSHQIHDHPELAFAEKQSAAWLVEACQQLGWQASSGICELPTAWK